MRNRCLKKTIAIFMNHVFTLTCVLATYHNVSEQFRTIQCKCSAFYKLSNSLPNPGSHPYFGSEVSEYKLLCPVAPVGDREGPVTTSFPCGALSTGVCVCVCVCGWCGRPSCSRDGKLGSIYQMDQLFAFYFT